MIEQLFVEQLKTGFARASVTNCARWAQKYRVIKGKSWTFDSHPWLFDMHLCEEPTIIGQKAAQMGFTEWALNKTFYYIGEKSLDVLYVLPSSDDAREFSSGRFDPALEESEYLRRLFSDVDNVSMKRAGMSTLYVRGSRSRSKLKSVPVAVLIFDEVAEMTQENIPLALERMSGQERKYNIQISTPTIQNKNINIPFQLSTKEEYHFRCPKCSRLTRFIFPESLIIRGEHLNDPKLKDSYIECYLCHNKLDHELKTEYLRHRHFGGSGHYVPMERDQIYRGFTVSQLYSTTVTPQELAQSHFRAITDASSEQEHYNSKGGVVHEAAGSRVIDTDLINCRKDFMKGKIKTNKIRTLGIDVGRVLHFVVLEWSAKEDFMPGLLVNEQLTPRLIYEGTSTGAADDFKEAYKIFMDYSCIQAVVDAEPERRAAYTFASSLFGVIWLCDYQSTTQGKQIVKSQEEELSFKCNRTSWLDLMLNRYKRTTIELPVDLSMEYKKHLKSLVRVWKDDKWGNPVGYYENDGPDHFAHAAVYAELALPIYFSAGIAQNIS